MWIRLSGCPWNGLLTLRVTYGQYVSVVGGRVDHWRYNLKRNHKDSPIGKMEAVSNWNECITFYKLPFQHSTYKQNNIKTPFWWIHLRYCHHYGDVKWAPKPLNSPAFRLFVQHLFNTWKKASTLCVTGLWEANRPVISGFPSLTRKIYSLHDVITALFVCWAVCYNTGPLFTNR